MAKKVKPVVIDAMTIWHARKPQYNGFTCGYGVHGDIHYNRRKEKAQFRKELGF